MPRHFHFRKIHCDVARRARARLTRLCEPEAAAALSPDAAEDLGAQDVNFGLRTTGKLNSFFQKLRDLCCDLHRFSQNALFNKPYDFVRECAIIIQKYKLLLKVSKPKEQVIVP